MNVKIVTILFFTGFLSLSALAQKTFKNNRNTILLTENWKFTKDIQEDASTVNYNDSKW